MPPGCATDDVFYNIYIWDADAGGVIVQEAVSPDMGYGMAQAHLSGSGSYILLIYNWADTSMETDIRVTTHSETSEVTLG